MNLHQLIEKQEQLKRSEQKYRIVAESTTDIIWEADFVRQKRFFSEKLYDNLGYKSLEMEPFNAWYDIVHPEDIGWVKKRIEKQIEGKIAVESLEYRVKCKDGNYKWLSAKTKCEYNENGDAIAAFGGFTDITKLKDQQHRINRRQACKYAKSIYDSGFTNFYVSVNVSTLQLLQRDFTDFVLGTLKNTGLPPELLLIEITETVLMESMDLVIEKLKILKSNNIKIALDDFGCGYSSLTYLKMLPINTVKIDKSFIDDIKSEDDMQSMTGNIILLAKQLGLCVIGEGVETMEQLNYLKKHGCDMFQGYLACKPVPEAEINSHLFMVRISTF